MRIIPPLVAVAVAACSPPLQALSSFVRVAHFWPPLVAGDDNDIFLAIKTATLGVVFVAAVLLGKSNDGVGVVFAAADVMYVVLAWTTDGSLVVAVTQLLGSLYLVAGDDFFVRK